jgi:hypothetical protein
MGSMLTLFHHGFVAYTVKLAVAEASDSSSVDAVGFVRPK